MSAQCPLTCGFCTSATRTSKWREGKREGRRLIRLQVVLIKWILSLVVWEEIVMEWVLHRGQHALPIVHPCKQWTNIRPSIFIQISSIYHHTIVFRALLFFAEKCFKHFGVIWNALGPICSLSIYDVIVLQDQLLWCSIILQSYDSSMSSNVRSMQYNNHSANGWEVLS